VNQPCSYPSLGHCGHVIPEIYTSGDLQNRLADRFTPVPGWPACAMHHHSEPWYRTVGPSTERYQSALKYKTIPWNLDKQLCSLDVNIETSLLLSLTISLTTDHGSYNRNSTRGARRLEEGGQRPYYHCYMHSVYDTRAHMRFPAILYPHQVGRECLVRGLLHCGFDGKFGHILPLPLLVQPIRFIVQSNSKAKVCIC
jgi:hypothetical protein